MKVFVINLERASDRREHIVSKLKQIGINFEIFNAIDGSTNFFYRDKYYVNSLRLLCYAKPLTNSQIACYASHYELWQKCIELNEAIVVLEDDIEFKDFFAVKLITLFEKIDKYEYIRLAGTFDRESICVDDDIKLYRKGPNGTIGYIISPSAARKLINHMGSWIAPVDDYMDKYWVHSVLPYCADPEIIFFKSEFESSMGDQPRANVLFKITRECFKLTHVVRKYLFDRLSLPKIIIKNK